MGPPRGHVGGTGLGVEALTAEPPATHTGEPRQARKGATVSRSLRVIGDHLARAEALGHAHRTAPDGGPHGPIYQPRLTTGVLSPKIGQTN